MDGSAASLCPVAKCYLALAVCKPPVNNCCPCDACCCTRPTTAAAAAACLPAAPVACGQALFRPITVVVPDRQLIMENMLMAEGFVTGELAAHMLPCLAACLP